MSLCQRSRHDLERIDPCQISLNRISLEEYFSRWLELQRRIVVEIYRPIWIVEEKNSHNYSIFLFTIDRPSSFHGFYPIFRSDSANRSREKGKKKNWFACKKRGSRIFACFRELCYFIRWRLVEALSIPPPPFHFYVLRPSRPASTAKTHLPTPVNAVVLERNHFARFIYVVTSPPLSAPFDLKVTRLPDKG